MKGNGYPGLPIRDTFFNKTYFAYFDIANLLWIILGLLTPNHITLISHIKHDYCIR